LFFVSSEIEKKSEYGSRIVSRELNLGASPQLEWWNNGIVEWWVSRKRNSKRIFLHWFSCSDVVFYVAKAENSCLMSIIKKCRLNTFCRKCYFPLSIPSIPIFHYSIIPCGLQKTTATKTIIIPISYRNYDTLNITSSWTSASSELIYNSQ